MATNLISRITSTAMLASNQLPKIISIVLIMYCSGNSFEAKGQQYPRPLTQAQLEDQNRQLNRGREFNKKPVVRTKTNPSTTPAISVKSTPFVKSTTFVAPVRYGTMKFYARASFGGESNLKTGYHIYIARNINSDRITFACWHEMYKYFDIIEIYPATSEKSFDGYYFGRVVSSVYLDKLQPYLNKQGTYTLNDQLVALEKYLATIKSPEEIRREEQIKSIEELQTHRNRQYEASKKYEVIKHFGNITFYSDNLNASDLSDGYLLKIGDREIAVTKRTIDGSNSYYLYELTTTSMNNYWGTGTIVVKIGYFLKKFSHEEMKFSSEEMKEFYPIMGHIPLIALKKIEARLKEVLIKEAEFPKEYDQLLVDIKRAAPFSPVKFFESAGSQSQFPWKRTYQLQQGYKLDVRKKDAFFIVRDAKDTSGKHMSWRVYTCMDQLKYYAAFSDSELGLTESEVTIEILKKIDQKLLDLSKDIFPGNFGLDFTGMNFDWYTFSGIKRESNGDYYYGQFTMDSYKANPKYSTRFTSLIKYADGRKEISMGEALCRDCPKVFIEKNGDITYGKTRLTADGNIIIKGVDYTNEIKKIKDAQDDGHIGNTENGAGVIRQTGNKQIIAGEFSTYYSVKKVAGVIQKDNGDIFFGIFHKLDVSGPAIVIKKSGEIVVGRFYNSFVTDTLPPRESSTIYYPDGNVLNTLSMIKNLDNEGITFSGYCTAINWATKEMFSGNYVNGKRDGKGIIYGKGALYLADDSFSYTEDGTSKKVIYKNGVLQQ